MRTGRLVVIGTSAGGLRALVTLLSQLPADFAAPVFVVQHLSPDADAEVIARTIGAGGKLSCKVASDGERFVSGTVYVAPADHHLLLKGSTILITKGARENRYRPAVDPLFRSAAVEHGSRVISIVLTGQLDDGTEGTAAVRRCGGTTIVQDPDEAEYGEMPRGALAAGAEYSMPLREMGAWLVDLSRRAPRKQRAVPRDIRLEAAIAARVVSDLPAVESLGTQVPYNCPNCGGVLWQITRSKTLRYRCHTGHAFTAASLVAEQSLKVEETLWVALRMLEERRNLLRRMRRSGDSPALVERERDAGIHIERIRELLKAGQQQQAPRPRVPRRARRVRPGAS